MNNRYPRQLVARLEALQGGPGQPDLPLEMSKIPHPPATTPGQAEILADFASKIPDIAWDYRRIEAKHVNIKGLAYDVFTLHCVGDDGSWDAPTLSIEFSLPCCRSACFCDYSGEAEMAQHIDDVVGGTLRLWFESGEPE